MHPVEADRVEEAATAAASAWGVGGVPSGSGGERPNPGMSSAITSRSAASRATTGSHTTSSAPSG